MRWHPRATLLALGLGACGDPEPTEAERLLDPEECESCHPNHYREWLGSMHAYASDDPVFLAMNRRGQRETNGELGDFCVRCHAPLAVERGATVDGLNLEELDRSLRGVTCYYCHAVDSVSGAHNNPLVLSDDGVMRASYVDAMSNGFHPSGYSALLDGQRIASSELCGSCHDLVNGHGVHLQRTYREWQGAFYSTPHPLDETLIHPALGHSCNLCHMPERAGPIADVLFAEVREIHDHRAVGVDMVLTQFPDADQAAALFEDQLEHILDVRHDLLCAGLCVQPGAGGGSEVSVWLHNEGAGHGWPSGALADRRAWVELVAHASDQVVLESGVLAEGQALDGLDDPLLWVLRDRLLDGDGNEVRMLWEAEGYESEQLPTLAEATDEADRAAWIERVYSVPQGALDRVNMRVRLRPVGLAILDDLIDSGDLDPEIRERVMTFTIEPTLIEWTPGSGEMTANHGSCSSNTPVCFSRISDE